MCGVIGLSISESSVPCWPDILESALQVQHRGQDACGIITGSVDEASSYHKGDGLVSEVFNKSHNLENDMNSSFGIAHGEHSDVPLWYLKSHIFG